MAFLFLLWLASGVRATLVENGEQPERTTALMWAGVFLGTVFLVAVHQYIWHPRDLSHDVDEHRRRLAACRIYTIYPPKQKRGSVAHVQFMSALLSAYPRLQFQVVGTPNEVVWRLVDSYGRYNREGVASMIQSYVGADGSDVRVEVSGGRDRHTSPPLPFYRRHIFFQLANEYAAPIMMPAQLAAYDPLRVISQHMAQLKREYNERVVYTLLLSVKSPQAYQVANRRFQQGRIAPYGGLSADNRGRQIVLDDRLVNEKMQHALYHAILVVTVESRNQKRLAQLARVSEYVTQFGIAGCNRLLVFGDAPKSVFASTRRITTEEAWWATLPEELYLLWQRRAQSWRDVLLVLSAPEFASLWHMPDETFTVGTIGWSEVRVPDEMTVKREDSVLLGTAVAPGVKKQVYLPAGDRAYHQFISGSTGAGKTTLMHNLIAQDIRAGRGVAVISPHRQLIDNILCALDTRHDDVVFLDASSLDHPIPLNPFRVPPRATPEQAASTLLWTIERLYTDLARYHRTEMAMRHLIPVLPADPEATPLDLTRFLQDDEYREWVITQYTKRPIYSRYAVQYWRDSYANESKGEKRGIARPVITRNGVFLSGAVENMMVHPNTLDFVSLVEGRKIVLVDLSGDLSEEQVGEVATLLVGGFFTACTALGEIVSGNPPRFYLYVDEFEQVGTGAFSSVLKQVRKYGLALVLATQILSDLDRRDSALVRGILGNITNLTTFQIGSDDAARMHPYYASHFSKEELINMHKYHIAIRASVDERTMPPFIAATPPPVPVVDPSYADVVRSQPNEQFGILPLAAVHEWQEKRYGDAADGGRLGRDPTPKPPPNQKPHMTKYD